MAEHASVRVIAPAVVIVIETEGPTRLFQVNVASGGDEDRLQAWLHTSPFRWLAVDAALKDRNRRGGIRAAAAWVRELGRLRAGDRR